MLTQPHTPVAASPHPDTTHPDTPHPDTSLPTFVVIGATKAGTTSLYHYLKQHPDIYMSPVKETKFFTVEEGTLPRENGPQGWRVGASHVKTLEAYRALFRDAQNERARGEASPQYLYYPEVPRRIHTHIPEAQIIAILRNPVDRAFSAFLHQTRDGKEVHTDFAAALQAEPERVREGWSPLYHYRAQGFYYEQLRRYYDVFDADKIHVYLYDDLRNDPLGIAENIFSALGVDETFVPNFETQHNISGVPKSKLLHRAHHFLRGSNRSVLKTLGKTLLPASSRGKMKARMVQKLEANNLEKPPFSPELRAELREAYRDDIGKLQGLINRDLSHWLK